MISVNETEHFSCVFGQGVCPLAAYFLDSSCRSIISCDVRHRKTSCAGERKFRCFDFLNDWTPFKFLCVCVCVCCGKGKTKCSQFYSTSMLYHGNGNEKNALLLVGWGKSLLLTSQCSVLSRSSWEDAPCLVCCGDADHLTPWRDTPAKEGCCHHGIYGQARCLVMMHLEWTYIYQHIRCRIVLFCSR